MCIWKGLGILQEHKLWFLDHFLRDTYSWMSFRSWKARMGIWLIRFRLSLRTWRDELRRSRAPSSNTLILLLLRYLNTDKENWSIKTRLSIKFLHIPLPLARILTGLWSAGLQGSSVPAAQWFHYCSGPTFPQKPALWSAGHQYCGCCYDVCKTINAKDNRRGYQLPFHQFCSVL